jgi:hypothetical protein
MLFARPRLDRAKIAKRLGITLLGHVVFLNFLKNYPLRGVAWIFISPERSRGCGRKNQTAFWTPDIIAHKTGVLMAYFRFPFAEKFFLSVQAITATGNSSAQVRVPWTGFWNAL